MSQSYSESYILTNNTGLLSISSFIRVYKMIDLYIKVAREANISHYSENNHRYKLQNVNFFQSLSRPPFPSTGNWFGALGLNMASLDLDFDFSDIVFLSFPLVLSVVL